MPGKKDLNSDEFKKTIPDKRERLIRFWIQGEWLLEAEKDLDKLILDFPEEKERVKRLRTELRSLKAEALLTEIERAKEAGRHRWAVGALKNFPKDALPPNQAVKITTMTAEYDALIERFNAAKQYLKDLPSRIKGADNKFLVDAAEVISEELHLDTTSRLDIFVTLAEQAEKDAAKGRMPSHKPEDLLSAAITGWHMGKASAEAKLAAGARVWKARLMVLEYLKVTSAAARNKIASDYLKLSDAIPFDELEKLISLLTPPDAEPDPKSKLTAKQSGPLPGLPKGLSYHIQLPEKYQHGRPYPLLILLPNAGMKSEELMAALASCPIAMGISWPQFNGPTELTNSIAIPPTSRPM